MPPRATSELPPQERQAASATITLLSVIAIHQKMALSPSSQAADSLLIGKILGLAVLVLRGTEFARGILPLPWLPQTLPILASLMITTDLQPVLANLRVEVTT